MSIGLEAIRPKKVALIDTRRVQREVLKAHNAFAAAIKTGMTAGYQRVAESPRYRRTGTYGRGWSAPSSTRITLEGVLIANRVRYAKWVGGPLNKRPGQARVMRRKGWPSITDVAREAGRRYRPLIIRAVKSR